MRIDFQTTGLLSRGGMRFFSNNSRITTRARTCLLYTYVCLSGFIVNILINILIHDTNPSISLTTIIITITVYDKFVSILIIIIIIIVVCEPSGKWKDLKA